MPYNHLTIMAVDIQQNLTPIHGESPAVIQSSEHHSAMENVDNV